MQRAKPILKARRQYVSSLSPPPGRASRRHAPISNSPLEQSRLYLPSPYMWSVVRASSVNTTTHNRSPTPKRYSNGMCNCAGGSCNLLSFSTDSSGAIYISVLAPVQCISFSFSSSTERLACRDLTDAGICSSMSANQQRKHTQLPW
jgi:hypothetical protein